MAEEAPKSWWQTMAGVMTGIAALLTASAGLIAALNKVGWIGPSDPPPIAHAPPPGPSKPTSPELPGSPLHEQPKTDSSSHDPDRKSHPIALPAQREYALGNSAFKLRYILLSANLTPYTAEADTLAIEIRAIGEGMAPDPSIFSSTQFELTIDEHPINPANYFGDTVPRGESRERGLRYIVPSTHPRAVLRIKTGAGAEIPLDLAQTAGSR